MTAPDRGASHQNALASTGPSTHDRGGSRAANPATDERSCRSSGAHRNADAGLLPGLVRPRGQQSVRLEGLRLPEALRRRFPARTRPRREGSAARPAALPRGRRRDDRRQRRDHRAPDRAPCPLDRRRLDGGPARHRPPRQEDARRPVLGHVLLAVEGPALLAGVQGRDAQGPSGRHRGRSGRGAGAQLQALPLPGHRTLRARRRVREGRGGPGGLGGPAPRARVPVRREAYAASTPEFTGSPPTSSSTRSTPR